MQAISPTSLYGQEFPFDHDTAVDSSAASSVLMDRVGQDRLSDDGREEVIKRAGDAVAAAMGRKEAARRRYLESSCLTDKADMDAAHLQAREALRIMEVLIGGRSAAQIARMERERGLA